MIPEEVIIDESPTIKDTADVAQFIAAIQSLTKKIKSIEEQRNEAVAFYNRSIEQVTKRIAFLEGSIEGWLQMNDKKSLATHHGTAILTTRQKTIWPDDEALLRWVLQQPNGSTLLETKSVVKKRNVEDLIRTGVEPPAGYEIVPTTSLSLRFTHD